MTKKMDYSNDNPHSVSGMVIVITSFFQAPGPAPGPAPGRLMMAYPGSPQVGRRKFSFKLHSCHCVIIMGTFVYSIYIYVVYINIVPYGNNNSDDDDDDGIGIVIVITM